MAWEEVVEAVSRPAGVDLSAWATTRFTVLKLNSSSQVIPVAASTDLPYGILLNDPKAGEAARVATGGIVKLRLGATVATGAAVAFDATGKGKTAATGNVVIGQAVEGGVSGDIVPVRVNFGSHSVAP